ncbi:hypothetical protein [Bordetella genomosp. 5]|uniref:Uncharacterized protein n=1 Tax=Bordetella genomosp. 5 TaxID=1395608 RepID=A0A261U239_9BORD|nr:hypothetical protein [Bordetella genomosp. 5]OZI55310.1 hypothetical protein CAL25_02555 [Bordetella genomosp. 5]
MKSRSAHQEPRIGAQLIPHFEQRNALRRSAPLIPFRWSELVALFRGTRPADRKQAPQTPCHSH